MVEFVRDSMLDGTAVSPVEAREGALSSGIAPACLNGVLVSFGCGVGYSVPPSPPDDTPSKKFSACCFCGGTTPTAVSLLLRPLNLSFHDRCAVLFSCLLSARPSDGTSPDSPDCSASGRSSGMLCAASDCICGGETVSGTGTDTACPATVRLPSCSGGLHAPPCPRPM
jgi:hypothetical protein